MKGSGLRVQGLGIRVQGLGCRVWVGCMGLDVGCRFDDSGLRVQGVGRRVGAGCRVLGVGYRIHDAGWRVQGVGLTPPETSKRSSSYRDLSAAEPSPVRTAKTFNSNLSGYMKLATQQHRY